MAVSASFADEDGQPVVPSAVAWSLYGAGGAVINERENIAPVPASMVTVVLAGDDLKIVDDSNAREKSYLVIAGAYTSSLGEGLPLRQSAAFWVLNTDPNTE